jgi:hypothetical protein
MHRIGLATLTNAHSSEVMMALALENSKVISE